VQPNDDTIVGRSPTGKASKSKDKDKNKDKSSGSQAAAGDAGAASQPPMKRRKREKSHRIGTREIHGVRKVEVHQSWRQVFDLPPPKIDYEPEPETEDGGVVDPVEAKRAHKAVRRALEQGGALFATEAGSAGHGHGLGRTKGAMMPFARKKRGQQNGQADGALRNRMGGDELPLWKEDIGGSTSRVRVGDAAFDMPEEGGGTEPMVLGEAGPAPGESLGGQSRHKGIMRAFNAFGSAAEAAAIESGDGEGLFGGDSGGAFQGDWQGQGQGQGQDAGHAPGILFGGR